jgi:hypothetical protein
MAVPAYYPSLEGKADPEVVRAFNHMRYLVHQLQVQVQNHQQNFVTKQAAAEQYGPEVVRKELLTAGPHFLSVHNLPGVLAQPQLAFTAVTAIPTIGDPLSREGSVVWNTSNTTLYGFHNGSWVAI